MFNNRAKALFAGFFSAILISFSGFSEKCENISEKVLRLHIIANSNSAEDQDLKIKVRDRVLKDCGKIFCSKKSLSEATGMVTENLDIITNAANNAIKSQGYNYKIRAEVIDMYFNTRHYNEVTLPAGVYKAVRITIGSGKGKNWWCVMFPPMCLPAAQEKKELGDVLNPDELDLVAGGEKYEIKFKAVEILKSIQAWFTSGFGLFFS